MKKKSHNILIAEDDANFGMMLKIFLEMNGYQVRLCGDGEEAYNAFKEDHFDIGIFDVMMPLVDGFALAERISKIDKNLPFVFLTAKALKEDQIRGYKIGALDYLIKPFDPEILLLKLNVLLSNTEKATASDSLSFEIGSFVFDYPKRILKLEKEERKLSPKEAELLKLLCEKDGEVLPHIEAMVKIWKNDDYFTKQSMNVFISKLRKYLSKDTSYQIEITNLHSTGFILEVKQ